MQRAKPILAAAFGAVVLLAGCADGDSISGPEPAGPSFLWCNPESCDEPQPGADTLPPYDGGPIYAEYEYGSYITHQTDSYRQTHKAKLVAFSDAQFGVETVHLDAYHWDRGSDCDNMILLSHQSKTELTNHGVKRLEFVKYTNSQPRYYYSFKVGVGGKVTATHGFTPARGVTGGGTYQSESTRCFYW